MIIADHYNRGNKMTYTISINGVTRDMTDSEEADYLREREETIAESLRMTEKTMREIRNLRLSECDWVVLRKTERDIDIPSAWSTYRQALRDLPTHANWPALEDADWPTKPE